MKVIANSSPLIALGRVQQLEIFKDLFQTIAISSAVYQETVERATNIRQKQAILRAIEQCLSQSFLRFIAFPGATCLRKSSPAKALF